MLISNELTTLKLLDNSCAANAIADLTRGKATASLSKSKSTKAAGTTSKSTLSNTVAIEWPSTSRGVTGLMQRRLTEVDPRSTTGRSSAKDARRDAAADFTAGSATALQSDFESTKATSTMSRCTVSNAWFSNSIAIRIREYEGNHIAIRIREYEGNQYNVKVYHQQCSRCETPIRAMLKQQAYADRVAFHIKRWNGIDIKPPNIEVEPKVNYSKELYRGFVGASSIEVINITFILQDGGPIPTDPERSDYLRNHYSACQAQEQSAKDWQRPLALGSRVPALE
ncbi:hypothetical protein FNAPI_3104 [Fusarium napiforme]|uniref:3CxxC-type domain-containing protein n=1 Tax=Fusarium napiforme TaxID=42672 RepID=A0A8H5JVM1_9HYPO|nr:hypothetical protein FNAPI_3104 [Fusarium napiforme]